MMPRPFLVGLLALTLAVTLLPLRATAQVGGLGDLPAKQTIASADVDRIRAYVGGFGPGLAAADRAEVMRSRDMLLRPLLGRGPVTGAFRREYAQALVPVLLPLLQAADDHQAANALRIAGELATQSIVDEILKALADPRSSVRYAASFALARIFDSVARFDPAVTREKLLGVVAALNGRLKPGGESDPLVLDGVVLALRSALRIVPAPTGIIDQAFIWSVYSDLARAAGDRLKALPKEEKPDGAVRVMIRITAALREAAVAANLNLPDAQRSATVRFCEDGVAAVAELRKALAAREGAGALSDAQKDQLKRAREELDALETALKTLRDLIRVQPRPGR